jgi:ABC-2 type transport system permease protein
MVPLLTMKSVAEERRLGTLEALRTTPATALEIVLGKYFAAYFLYLGLWALTLLFPWIAQEYLPVGRVDPRLVDPASLLGGFLFVAVSGTLYIAVGIFSSSLTRSTLVAGMVAFSLLFILVLSAGLLQRAPIHDLEQFKWIEPVLAYMQSFRHLEDFCLGVIDSRPFFYYASNTLLVLGLTTLLVEGRTTA